MTLYLHGMGHYHPPTVLDNTFFEGLAIDTSAAWILDRVGIVERRTVLDKSYIQRTGNADLRQALAHCTHTTADCAHPAATMALQNAGIRPDQIGMVVASCCAPSYLVPATASLVAAAIGADQATCMDLNTACSSFAVHLHWLAAMDAAVLPDYVLSIQVENWSTTIDYRDRNSCVLVGDAVSAAVVSKRFAGPARLVHSTMASSPVDWPSVQTPVHAPFNQQGRAVQKFAVKRTVSTFHALNQAVDVDLSQHYFIGHQANLTMLRSVVRRIDVAEQRHFYNVDRFGNCASAGAPSVLSQHWQDFKPGDWLTLVVVGAGLTWAGLVFTFGYDKP